MRPNALFNFQLLVISFYLLVSMFCNKLQNIEALLLYLFKFIFHANNQFLDVMIIGFGTHGIDFATDFLGDESEFTSRGLFFLHSLDKIFTMICQTNFLFRNIQFFQIIDNFLSNLFSSIFLISPHSFILSCKRCLM